VSIRTILVVILALVFGGSAAVGINTLRNSAPEGPRPDTVALLVAAVDVPRFATLGADHLKTWDCPKELAPPGALTNKEEVIGRVALTQLMKGEVLLESKLAPKGVGRGMAPGITKGKRAFTIQTPTVASNVAGFILPGNKVDVLLTANVGGLDITVTLVQDVEILAVDQRVDAPAENKVDVNQLRSVTLLVTPDDAARLDLGQNKGILHLSLRHPEDSQRATARRTTMAELGLVEEKPKEPEPEVAPEPPPPVRIRTLRGSQEGGVDVYPTRRQAGR
jgi:pilus assembly protein CpaB